MANSNYLSAPAANTAAAVTLGSNERHITRLVWSYSGAPTGGSVIITENGVPMFKALITAAGPGFLPVGQNYASGVAVVATLAAGGDGVTGTLTVVP